MLVSNQRGFTLLEILIAITLLAFITLGVVSITENAVLTKERTTEINKNNLQIETALSRFEWDFLQIYSPLYFSKPFTLTQGAAPGAAPVQPGDNQPNGGVVPNQNLLDQRMQSYYQEQAVRFERNENFSFIDETGIPIPRFYSPEKNIFEFFTTSNRRKMENTKQSHFAWVRYTLAEQVDEDRNDEKEVNIPSNLKSLVRYFSADNPYSDRRMNPEDEGVKAAVLLKNVESLEFQFWNYERKKWETNLKTIPNGESVLRGVKILLSWYDNNGSKRTIQRIFRNHWPMQLPQDLNQNPNTLNTNLQRTDNENNQ